MKKTIYRNIAVLSAIFVCTFSIMLITNYFQIRQSAPLQTKIIENLKELNIQNSGNTELQEQIRQLDLMARKAYFVSMERLMSGLYILLGMLFLFLVSTRLYFANYRNIPEKELDPIDEWLIKTQARKYVGFAAAGIVAIALGFALLSTPFLSNNSETGSQQAASEPVAEPVAGQSTTTVPEQVAVENEGQETLTADGADEKPADNAPAETANPTETVAETKTTALVNTVNFNAFRGNSSNGVSVAKNVPSNWNLEAGTHVAWKKPIPMKGNSSPIINGDKVFFTGANESSRVLYCYDLNNGASLWQLAADKIAGSPAKAPKTTSDTGLASSTAATNGKQVCAIFGTGDLLCADMAGKLLWAKNLGIPDNHYGYASSLITYQNLLIVQWDNQNDSRLMAFDMASGQEKWKATRKEKITWSSPIIAQIDGKAQLVLMGNPNIAAYNPLTGEELWHLSCLSGEVGASACSANGIVYGASEYAALTAINGADGSQLWQASDFLPEVSSPVATANKVYVATSYGVIAAYNGTTGALEKQHELNNEFYSSPIIAEGKIFLFSTDGTMHIFSTDDEFKLLSSVETGERTFATPAFTDGKIVVRTEENIYCVTAN